MRFTIRVLRCGDCALRSTNGELVKGLSSEVRPTTDLRLLDSEPRTGNTKIGLKSPPFAGNQETRLVLPRGAKRLGTSW